MVKKDEIFGEISEKKEGKPQDEININEILGKEFIKEEEKDTLSDALAAARKKIEVDKIQADFDKIFNSLHASLTIPISPYRALANKLYEAYKICGDEEGKAIPVLRQKLYELKASGFDISSANLTENFIEFLLKGK
jgi:hypothetical protein